MHSKSGGMAARMLAERIRKLLGVQEGFTLVEMMAVLIIIAVLVGIGIKFFSGFVDEANVRKATADIHRMQSGLELFYTQNGYYPTGDDQVELAMAGIDPDTVTTNDVATSVPYEYKNTDTVSGNYETYAISTSVRVDGNDFVMGTGDSGNPSEPVTTADNGL